MKYLFTLLLMTACAEEMQVVQGPKGDKGDTGAQGIAGQNGLDGEDGIDGKDGIDGADGKDGVDGKDGKDGTNGTNGSDAVAQVTSVNFVNTTACKEIINESGLVVYGKKSSSTSDKVIVYFNNSCTGNSETLGYDANETMFIGRNLLVVTGRNNSTPQPLTVSRVKL